MKDKDYRDYDESEGEGKAVGYALGVTLSIVLAILIGVAILLLSGCTSTKYVPVETVRTEYKENIREVHTSDSVVDTRFVYIKGDTVVDWRDRVKWRDRFIHDSVYIERTDTIREPYPVEKQLTRWQQTKQDYGGAAIATCAVLILAFVAWLARRCSRR